MKKIIICLSLFLLCMNLGVSKVEADEYGFPEYHVTFDGSKLQSNDYSREEIKKVLEGMQPGDKAEITWVLSNNSDKDVDWWMSNDTMKTFEEDKRNTVEGGNYTYKLNYVDTKNVGKELYNSDSVGGTGEGSNGLQDATNALDDLFLLETIKAGNTSKLTMSFELDGETQANNYQDVLGTLVVNFAVELNDVGTHEPGTKYEEIVDEKPSEKTNNETKKTRRVVYLPYTGDTFNPVLYIVAEVGLLVVLIVLVISYKNYLKKQEGK